MYVCVCIHIYIYIYTHTHIYMLLNCDIGEDPWEFLALQGDPTSPSYRKSVLNIHWKDWGWSWNSNTLATWCKELTPWKRPLCWERLKVGGEGDDRGWDGWMASPTQWTWVWVNSGSWWWTGRPGVLQSMGLQRVGHNWTTKLNWWTSNDTVKSLLVINVSIWCIYWEGDFVCVRTDGMWELCTFCSVLLWIKFLLFKK